MSQTSCMIYLLPCLFCPSVGLMHAISPALPLLLSVGLLQIYLLPCHFYLSVGLMHATSPAFPVHLTACCMINLLPCLYCPSVSLLHDLLPALPGIETNAQMFRYRSLGSKRNQNVLVCSKIFFSKKECFYLFQKLLNETKTFCCVPEFFTGTLLCIPRT